MSEWVETNRAEADAASAERRRALARETLVSERLRARLLAGMIGVALLLYLAVAHAPGFAQGAMRTQLRAVRPQMVALVLLAIAYELFAGAYIGHLLRRKKPARHAWAYLSSAVEISFPTAAILCWAGAFDAPSALASVSTLFYLLFILFSILRLDFWLCVFTGLLAAVQYAVVALVLLARPDSRALADNFARDFARALDLAPAPVTAVPASGSWAGRVTRRLAQRLIVGPAGPRADLLVEPAHHLLAASVYALAGLVAGFVSLRVRRQFSESLRLLDERNRVVNLFGQHVSPAVVDKLLHQPIDQGENRHVCVMFLDIRDFTRFAERRSPEEVVAYLNRLFSSLIDVVNDHKGIVNKFLGDGFMAVFGAPVGDGQDSSHAVAASLRILECVDRMNAAGDIPPTRLGIGLHAGDAVTGTVGSKSRKEYTIIGSVVNLASRIEKLNKELGTQLLVSEKVWAACGRACPPDEDCGPRELKGVETPMRVYKLA